MKTTKYIAVPALPAEQQDETLNPSHKPLGWVVITNDQHETIIWGYRKYNEREDAERKAAELSAAS